jgi:hypothetical protein
MFSFLRRPHDIPVKVKVPLCPGSEEQGQRHAWATCASYGDAASIRYSLFFVLNKRMKYRASAFSSGDAEGPVVVIVDGGSFRTRNGESGIHQQRWISSVDGWTLKKFIYH